MSFETERMIHEDAPTPAQLRRLVRIGFGQARVRNAVRRAQDLDIKHYFTDDLIDGLDERDEGSYLVSRRVCMRFGLVPSESGEAPTAHLHYFDTERAYPVTGEVASPVQAVYKFEWSRSKVLLAKRAFRHLDGAEPQERPLDSYLDSVSVPDYIASIIEQEDAQSAVTKDDCDALIATATMYAERLRSQTRASY